MGGRGWVGRYSWVGGEKVGLKEALKLKVI